MVGQQGNAGSLLKSVDHFVSVVLATCCTVLLGGAIGQASDFSEPWKRNDRALVIDAYEYNPIDWQKLVGDKRIAGFINKASDGLPPPYKCSGGETQVRLCKALWKRHAVARELFHTRRTVAKTLNLKWGAYHLGRPGNPIDQANNFIDFAEPAPDDLIALDIEDNDPQKWMSLEDAETFARHVYTRLKRWPVLYTNGSTALYIAENRDRYKVLSRLPLWYARYKPAIGLHFPKGYWKTYALWQFSASANCDAKSCPYRPPGTPLDIDVNVASMSVDELRAEWPFDELVEEKEYPDTETVPVPVARRDALKADEIDVEFVKVSNGEEPEIEVAQAVPPVEAVVEKPPVVPSLPETITVETGEKIPLPIWRKDARKKRADVTLKFVAVEQVIVKGAVETAVANKSPFQALLGKQAVATAPIVLAGYAQMQTLRTPRLPTKQTAAKPGYVPSGEVSTAARDEPGPVLSATQFSRRELPIFLLKKLDGPDEVQP
ncbi:MAG: glycoside hydrolase family 25 protein [Rhizobiaceae bacterium]|nr:glycoside hydrolase family 25 protein [Rhizobiaceae bacterium]